ncbi:hypothetical protein Glove_100g16 [Diversispora epigaea]|uniref:BRCA2 OB3 domain-containing protein n=1 Tax=Diversispora epigaea TaxID=1348612 RepID=A0A397J3W6_9GLOM|nr:hypothetical protein Glove_100g16 [Diversispora epigaea]
MNSKQIERLHDYMQRKEQKKASKMNQWISEQLETLDGTRDVVPFFKIRVFDYHSYSNDPCDNEKEAIITIWNPEEHLIDSLREGQRYQIHSLSTATNQSLPIRLNSVGHSTLWKEISIDTYKKLYVPRKVTLCDDLWDKKCNEEVDMVGITLVEGELITRGQRYNKPIQIKNVIVTDSSGQIVQIEIKNPFSICMNELLKPKNILAFINLHYRVYDPRHSVFILSTCDETEIKISPREIYLQEAKKNLENWTKSHFEIIEKLEAKAIELCNPTLVR